MRRSIVAVVGVIVFVTCAGCLSWKPAWDEAGPGIHADVGAPALEKARRLTRTADSAEKLQEAIAAYEQVLEQQPAHYEALTSVADSSILLGTAYTSGKKKKRKLFLKAMQYSELAMYTNPAFRELVDQGELPWAASRALTNRELDAMQAWVTAVLYQFKEAMGLPARVINIRWIERLEPVLERMDEIDDGWIEGATAFDWGFYYFILPKSRGGNRDTAAEMFTLATELSENRMYARWGRAKFFSRITNNKEEFRRDMEWIAAQNPAEYADPPQWKAYFQADARELLEDVDGYFETRP